VLDLFAAALSEQLGCEPSVRPETRRHALVLQIKAFIDARLDDPELTTATIAAAHYISPRYLRKLFEAEGSARAAGSPPRGRAHQQDRRPLGPAGLLALLPPVPGDLRHVTAGVPVRRGRVGLTDRILASPRRRLMGTWQQPLKYARTIEP
jgi:AraC-like DNA-binding protein